jgi:Protein of unknown function (DUF2878)
MAPRLVACFVLGALLGTLLDGIHAYGDVLAYPDPDFGRWAWFVPLEFGLLGLGAGLVVPGLERLVAPGAVLVWSLARRVFELALFAGLYFVTTLVEGDGAIWLGLALGLLAALRLLRREAPGDWAYVVAASVLGPATEAAMSALGAFDYLDPDVAGIPFWLPGLWANGGLLIRRLIRPIVLPQPLRRERRTGADRS